MSEIPSKNEQINDLSQDNNFLELAIKSLEDNNLNQNEKDEINEYLSQYSLERESIQEETSNQIQEIKNEIELKNIIEDSNDFEEIENEIKSLSRQEVKNIQYITWSYVDGLFWVNTYIKYKNAPISDIFTPKQISSGRRVWEDVKWFIDNFSKLNWVDSELLAIILSNDISPDSFIFIDDKWNITIMDKWNNNNTLVFSETASIEWLLHESFIQRDLSKILNQLNLLWRKDDRVNYINKLRNIIFEYNYQREARKMFSQTTSNWVEIKLPEANLNREMRAVDLFWDYQELVIDGELYINNWIWDFLTESWRRLSIFNWQVLKIEEFIINQDDSNSRELSSIEWENQDNNLWEIRPQARPENIWNINSSEESNLWNIRPRPRPENLQTETIRENIESNLSKEFWEWLAREWGKHLWRTWPNSCWLAVYRLIDTFMRSKSIRNSLNISYQRHWANFDSILTWEINSNNPFILQWWNSTWEIKNSRELNDAWIDINNIINDNIEVKIRDINYPKDALAWEILVYNEDAQASSATNARRKFWHVEIKWNDNNYYSYYKSSIPWGSAKVSENISAAEYARLTWFNWKAYSLGLKS